MWNAIIINVFGHAICISAFARSQVKSHLIWWQARNVNCQDAELALLIGVAWKRSVQPNSVIHGTICVIRQTLPHSSLLQHVLKSKKTRQVCWVFDIQMETYDLKVSTLVTWTVTEFWPPKNTTSSPGRNRAGSPVLMRPSTVFFPSLIHCKYGCLRGSLHGFLRRAEKLEVKEPSSRGRFRVHESRISAKSLPT